MRKILPNLFFLFLTAPILSPFIGGVTIYLSALIVFLDPFFIKWFLGYFRPQKVFVTGTVCCLMAAACLQVPLLLKLIMISTSVCYVLYCYLNGLFFLYKWVSINILIAIAQFVLIFINPDIAYQIGPTNISKMIWGDLATPTYTNFFALSILPRVSGLSREGGFFASLLGVAFFTALFDGRLRKETKWKYLVLFSIGLIISISKTTSLLLIVPFILLFRRHINALGTIVASTIYLFTQVVFWQYVFDNSRFFLSVENETFIHRFIGYALTPYAKINDFITGTNIIDLLLGTVPNPGSIIFDLKGNLITEFCGLPGIYLSFGIIVYLLFLFLMKFFKISASSFLILLALTTNVSPFTSDGFVILAWFLIIVLGRDFFQDIDPSGSYEIDNFKTTKPISDDLR